MPKRKPTGYTSPLKSLTMRTPRPGTTLWTCARCQRRWPLEVMNPKGAKSRFSKTYSCPNCLTSRPMTEDEQARVVGCPRRGYKGAIGLAHAYVLWILKKHGGWAYDFDLLLTVAYAELVKAALTFHPDNGFEFSTHAMTYLKNRLRPGNLEQCYRDGKRGLLEELGARNPRHSQLGHGKFKKYEDFNEAAVDTKTVNDDLDGSSEARAIEAVNFAEWVRRRVRSDRDYRVIQLRFGLDGERARSFSEIAQELRVSKERVRQIEVRTMKYLRDAVASGRSDAELKEMGL